MTPAILDALRMPGQPAPLVRALAAELARRPGYSLFTILLVDGRSVARVFSTDEASYPVSGRKEMGVTPWGEKVLRRQEPFLGRDEAALRWAFPDHELIASLGLETAINIPVVYDGHCLGTLNILDGAGRYDEAALAAVASLAPCLIPALLAHRVGAPTGQG